MIMSASDPRHKCFSRVATPITFYIDSLWAYMHTLRTKTGGNIEDAFRGVLKIYRHTSYAGVFLPPQSPAEGRATTLLM